MQCEKEKEGFCDKGRLLSPSTHAQAPVQCAWDTAGLGLHSLTDVRKSVKIGKSVCARKRRRERRSRESDARFFYLLRAQMQSSVKPIRPLLPEPPPFHFPSILRLKRYMVWSESKGIMNLRPRVNSFF